MRKTKIIEWILRIGAAGEFLGHGLLSIEGKKDWISWVTQMTRPNAPTGAKLLLLVGISDVIVALIVLIKPMRPVLLWAAFWGFWTALVRPLVGAGWLDFIERFAKWAA